MKEREIFRPIGSLNQQINSIALSHRFRSILVLLFIILFQYQQVFSATDKYRLMLNGGNPATSITIGWNQISGNNPTVYYDTIDHGTDYTAYSNSQTPYRSVEYFEMDNQFVKLEGLMPNTIYYFLIHDSEGISQRYWFRTFPNDNSEGLSFISGGDSRSGTNERANANRMVAKIRPHAVLFGGDLVAEPINVSVQKWLDDWQLTITSDKQMIPAVHSFGNHDAYSDGGPEFFQNLFDIDGDTYYKVTFGDNLFSVYTLNSELYPGHQIPNSIKRAEQNNWLKNNLQDDDAIWKSVQYHRPILPHNSIKGKGKDEFNDWAQLFYDNDVRLVMESDAHCVKITEEVKPSSPTVGDDYDNWFTTSGIEEGKGITFIGEGSWGTKRVADISYPITTAKGSFYQFGWIIVETSKIEIRVIDTQSPATIPEHEAGDYFSISEELEAVIWKPDEMPSGVRQILKTPMMFNLTTEVDAYQLSCYPNPFSGKTTISYTLKNSSNVKLIVFDSSGKEVKVLFNQAQSPGEYRVELDAIDLKDGIYFYQLRDGVHNITKKMILSK